jgi:hypothetical protein
VYNIILKQLTMTARDDIGSDDGGSIYDYMFDDDYDIGKSYRHTNDVWCSCGCYYSPCQEGYTGPRTACYRHAHLEECINSDECHADIVRLFQQIDLDTVATENQDRVDSDQGGGVGCVFYQYGPMSPWHRMLVALIAHADRTKVMDTPMTTYDMGRAIMALVRHHDFWMYQERVSGRTTFARMFKLYELGVLDDWDIRVFISAFEKQYRNNDCDNEGGVLFELESTLADAISARVDMDTVPELLRAWIMVNFEWRPTTHMVYSAAIRAALRTVLVLAKS